MDNHYLKWANQSDLAIKIMQSNKVTYGLRVIDLANLKQSVSVNFKLTLRF